MTAAGIVHDVLMDEFASTPHVVSDDECWHIANAILRALRDEYPMEGIRGEWYTTIPVNEYRPAS